MLSSDKDRLMNDFHYLAQTFNSGGGGLGASGSSANAASQTFNADGFGGGLSGKFQNTII